MNFSFLIFEGLNFINFSFLEVFFDFDFDLSFFLFNNFLVLVEFDLFLILFKPLFVCLDLDLIAVLILSSSSESSLLSSFKEICFSVSPSSSSSFIFIIFLTDLFLARKFFIVIPFILLSFISLVPFLFLSLFI